MQNIDLDRIHELNFMILKKFKSVCEANDICYYLAAGTLLGAAREHDFIAWDDDIDINIPRESYEKLIRLPADVWGDDFKLLKYNEVGMDEYFYDFVPRLLYVGEKIPFYGFEQMGECCDKRYKNYARLDIFVMDNTYCSLGHKFISGLQAFVYGLALGHRPLMNLGDYKGFSKIAVVLFSNIGKFFSLKEIYSLYEKICTKVKKDYGYIYVSNAEPFDVVFQIRKKECYSGKINLPIRDEMFSAPCGYDALLKMRYGDYLTPPPEDERIPAHRIVND